MRRAPTGALFLALLAGCVTAPPPQSTAAYDRAFDDIMARYHLPGLAVGVIEDGRVVYTRTEGELVAGSGDRIDRQTLFKIASNSKAMTASVLARLVEAGKLRWDDPVIKHLPDFRMHDPWVTQHMQVRDLLVHNSGLPAGAGDLMLWPEPNHFTRDDIIAGLAYLEPEYGFRSGYAYDNLLYVVAGEVAAAAGGASYEQLVRREVFEPLELDCIVGAWRSEDVGNVAQPHRRVGGRNVPVRADGAVVPAITSAAAGGIRCSLDAMLAWARNWLAPTPGQLEWLPPEQRRAMWTARTPMPISDGRRAWNDTHYYAYAFGFRLADVDGAWTVSHTGTLMGMYSAMTLLPDRASGFVLMTNGAGSEARTVLNEVLLKQFTAPEQGRTVDWYADAIARDRESAMPGGSSAPDTSRRTPARPAGLRIGTGLWRDPWFGDVSICARGDEVRFRSAKSPLLTGTVMRVGERYLVDWDDESVSAEAWLDFAAGAGDTKPQLTMAKVDPQADFSFDYEDLHFTRTGECE
ncbi:MAG TPA: serine hydrolase [Woeseiaceae bacterium]|nr:serine hydrolase [Woeseiaceae bacterium]